MARYGNGGSGVCNTAWALLALMAAKTSDRDAVARGVAYLVSQQRPNGDWKQEGIAGVFNRACGISYTQCRPVLRCRQSCSLRPRGRLGGCGATRAPSEECVAS